MASNGDIYTYCIKLLVRNIDEPFLYEVGAEEIDRLKERLSLIEESEPDQILPKLFSFSTVNKLTVLVSVDDIQLAHFLWEKNPQPPIDEGFDEDDPDREDIHYYFRSKPHKYVQTVDEAPCAASLYFQLELGTFDESEFHPLVDADGEEVFVHLRDIVLVEFRTKILDEGFDELKKEVSD
jgi:hypothetical protein